MKIKAKKVMTPGSARLEAVAKPKKKIKKTVGRPTKKPAKKVPKGRSVLGYRADYTVEDMAEAVRLVRDEGKTIKFAAKVTNSRKLNEIPRKTLSDRLNRKDPSKSPKLGRPLELGAAAEAALVKCLKMCASFQYPMRRKDLQDLVQSYVVENGVNTRWKDGRPGKGWIRKFQKRWRHEVKLKKPTNIKRSRAAVSPTIVGQFIDQLEVTL